MNEEEVISVFLTAVIIFVLWLLALTHYTFVTVLLTALFFILGGAVQTSGRGDGRNGRRH